MNLCKKCGEFRIFFAAITAFLKKMNCIHRISYKNSPKNLDPGKESHGLIRVESLIKKSAQLIL